MKKAFVIPALAATCILGLLLSGPTAQDVLYHNFADQRTFWGIPNFYNVVTNLPFAFVAIAGFISIRGSADADSKNIGYALFLGFFLLTFGSGYYHLRPDNNSLVLDRLPIAVLLASFFTYVIQTHVRLKRRVYMLVLFNLIGVLSVLYWGWTEMKGRGDLRWYGFTQFFPIIAIPLLLLLYRSPKAYWIKVVPIFLFFALAKVCEKYDVEIYNLLAGSFSGHSLKHLLMAAAGFIL